MNCHSHCLDYGNLWCMLCEKKVSDEVIAEIRAITPYKPVIEGSDLSMCMSDDHIRKYMDEHGIDYSEYLDNQQGDAE